MSNISIEQIKSWQCIDLRTRILRPGQPVEICHYAEDNLTTTFHLGAIVTQPDGSHRIAANGTFIQHVHPQFPTAKNPYRLRGMATDTEFQGQGFGSTILQQAEMILKSLNCDLLWFNAREKAFHFYERNGYLTIGDMFDIPGAGPHKVMYKWL